MRLIAELCFRMPEVIFSLGLFCKKMVPGAFENCPIWSRWSCALNKMNKPDDPNFLLDQLSVYKVCQIADAVSPS